MGRNYLWFRQGDAANAAPPPPATTSAASLVGPDFAAPILSDLTAALQALPA
jgi:hypothetical protein